MTANRIPEPDPPDPWAAERLIDRPPSGVEPSIGSVEAVVEALRAPGAPSELGSQETYLQVFDTVQGGRRPPRAAGTTGRGSVRTVVVGVRAAAAALALVLAVGGVAAAYAGGLPRSAQRAAHRLIGAPAPGSHSTRETTAPSSARTNAATRPSSGGASSSAAAGSRTAGSTTAGPAGSDRTTMAPPTDPAAFGQCTAWSKGGLASTSAAYRKLATAAGGEAGIPAYCAAVLAAEAGETGDGHAPKPSKTKAPSTPQSNGRSSPTSHGQDVKESHGKDQGKDQGKVKAKDQGKVKAKDQGKAKDKGNNKDKTKGPSASDG